MEYQPINGSQLSGQITIAIENPDDFFHPRHSWLLVEGDLVKAANETRYGDNDLISLTNNAIMYFTNMKYSLGSLIHPGFATSMLGLLKYSLDYAKGLGLVQCWYPDASIVAAENNVGFAA